VLLQSVSSQTFSALEIGAPTRKSIADTLRVAQRLQRSEDHVGFHAHQGMDQDAARFGDVPELLGDAPGIGDERIARQRRGRRQWRTTGRGVCVNRGDLAGTGDAGRR